MPAVHNSGYTVQFMPSALAEEALSPLHLDQHRFTQFLRGDPVSTEKALKSQPLW